MDLKYALPPFKSGFTYQLPARSLAITGRSESGREGCREGREEMKEESWKMDVRWLVIDNVERFKEERMAEKLWFAWELKTRSEVVMGGWLAAIVCSGVA